MYLKKILIFLSRESLNKQCKKLNYIKVINIAIMKKIVVLMLGVCLLGGVAKAQTLESKYGLDSAQTLIHTSIYTEFVKQKNYTEALPAWRYVFNNAPMF